MSLKSKARMLLMLSALGILFCAMPVRSFAGIAVSIRLAPPVLPVYAQPPCPAEGYMWTPGYWAWAPAGYYWAPGMWVRPPRVGLLWTPGYWGFGGGGYMWHGGYWGPHVGFYGGVNYGFGYMGTGFVGGFWSGNVFRYNAAVINVNRAVVRNVYVDRTVIRNSRIVSRVSFNGPGGVRAEPNGQERMAMRERHFQASQGQMAHRENAPRGNNRVNEQRYEQQERIGQGVRPGQMTRGERQQVNREQNHASREIRQEKHNDRGATK